MSAYSRRKILNDRMSELEASGFDCRNCQGTCCTFEANSMMVTPLEAVELMRYLRASQNATDELKAKCQSTVTQYRLDAQTGNGRRSYLRRTYTCSFFNFKELGCPLPREYKPYGCLAFNAHHATEKAGEHCYSELDLLKKREEQFPEEAALNERWKQKLNLYWEKSPLPLALLDLWDKEISDGDPE